MLKSSLVAVFLLFSTLVFAETKIAFLDKNVAMFQSEAARAETEKLKQEFGPDEQRIRSIEQQVTEIRGRLETDSAIMAEADVQTEMNLVNSLLAERKSLVDKLTQIQQQRQQAFVKNYQPVLLEAIKDVVAAESIDLMLDAQSVIYAGDGFNVTDLVLAAFNARVLGSQ
jgi:outer membrane protein